MTMQRMDKLAQMDPMVRALRNKQVNGVSLALFFMCIVAGIAAAAVLDARGVGDDVIAAVVIGFVLLGIFLLFALKIANQWEKAIVLRFGKFRGLRGPGLFWMVPIVDSVPMWIDHRVMVTPFNAEKTLTQDTTQSTCPP